MTLSLDDVRSKRFRMARKSGYEVLEVDEFVDEVEESFAQLLEENRNLKQQVEALTATGAAGHIPAAPATDAEASDEPTSASTRTARAPESVGTEPVRIVVTTAKEASTAVVRLVEMTTEQAERLLAEASEDAHRVREEANQSAHQVTTDARTRAEQLESEAQANADRLQADALASAEQLDREIQSRRTDMLSSLERERDEFSSAVSDLRRFEATYRTTMVNHLRSQLEAVQAAKAEPTEVPLIVREMDSHAAEGGSDDTAAAGAVRPGNLPGGDGENTEAPDGASPSETPRLDALLGDDR